MLMGRVMGGVSYKNNSNNEEDDDMDQQKSVNLGAMRQQEKQIFSSSRLFFVLSN